MSKKLLTLLTILSLLAIPGIVLADPPFDFSDDFYRQNGIKPEQLRNRIKPDGVKAVTDTALNATRNNTRITEITGGFDMNGNVIYYTVSGMVFPDTFTPDPLGLKAMTIANEFRAFIFPKQGAPDVPGAPARRQDNLFETKTGYFDRNPLGLWWIFFVRYTDAALNTVFGQNELNALAAKNGLDLDGTPVIKRMSEIEDFAKKGLVRVRGRDLSGAEGFPWVI